MSTAKINGIDIHYEISGEGPTVVWLHGLLKLHGLLNSSERARLLGEGLEVLPERGFRLITYDARGHGASGFTPDESDYTWTAHAADLHALLDHLDIERAIVGGGSMGAGVSVVFALEHPERVEKLVLLVPPPLADTIATAQQVFGGLASLIESLGLEKAAEIVLNLPEYKQMLEQDPSRYEQMRQWLFGLRPDASVATIRGLLNGPALPEDRFAEITKPALIIGQPDDAIHPTSTAEKLHAAIAGSRLVIAPAFDYYRTHQAELVDTVVSFLRADAGAK